MSTMTCDGASLVAAAVRAAVLAKVPWRTVGVVAVPVTSALVSAKLPRASARADTQSNADDAEEPTVILDALRAARKAQRIRKNERRRAAKAARDDITAQNVEAAAEGASLPSLSAALSLHAGAVDQPAELGNLAAASAQAPATLQTSNHPPPSLTAAMIGRTAQTSSPQGSINPDQASSMHDLSVASSSDPQRALLYPILRPILHPMLRPFFPSMEDYNIKKRIRQSASKLVGNVAPKLEDELISKLAGRLEGLEDDR